jgi:hypothetical protein
MYAPGVPKRTVSTEGQVIPQPAPQTIVTLPVPPVKPFELVPATTHARAVTCNYYVEVMGVMGFGYAKGMNCCFRQTRSYRVGRGGVSQHFESSPLCPSDDREQYCAVFGRCPNDGRGGGRMRGFLARLGCSC